jgi:hypothetical protein
VGGPETIGSEWRRRNQEAAYEALRQREKAAAGALRGLLSSPSARPAINRDVGEDLPVPLFDGVPEQRGEH